MLYCLFDGYKKCRCILIFNLRIGGTKDRGDRNFYTSTSQCIKVPVPPILVPPILFPFQCLTDRAPEMMVTALHLHSYDEVHLLPAFVIRSTIGHVGLCSRKAHGITVGTSVLTSAGMVCCSTFRQLQVSLFVSYPTEKSVGLSEVLPDMRIGGTGTSIQAQASVSKFLSPRF